MENKMQFTFKICSLPATDLVFENALFVNEKDFETMKKSTNSKHLLYCHVKNSIMHVKGRPDVQQGHLAMGKLYRESIGVSETIGQLDIQCI
jgi:hypothetical protein